MNEQRSRNATRLWQVGKRDVIIDDHHVDLQAKSARPFRSQPEIQPVPGIVLDDQQATCRAGDGEDARQHCIDRRRCEDIAADRGCQHTLAYETGMGRFVAGPTTRDQRDFGLVPIRTQHNPNMRIAVQPGEIAA